MVDHGPPDERLLKNGTGWTVVHDSVYGVKPEGFRYLASQS